jgi:hypothetical protein
MQKRSILAAIAAVAVVSTAVYAEVVFNSDDGTGFVGKGDVQLLFGWNNKALQDNVNDVEFRYSSSTEQVTEYDWTCTNTNNENVNERKRDVTTTSSVQGLVESVGRLKNQITGFNILDWDGQPTISISTESSGQPLWSCPTNWVLGGQTTTTGAPVTTGGGLQVRGPGFDWTNIE